MKKLIFIFIAIAIMLLPSCSVRFTEDTSQPENDVESGSVTNMLETFASEIDNTLIKNYAFVNGEYIKLYPIEIELPDFGSYTGATLALETSTTTSYFYNTDFDPEYAENYIQLLVNEFDYKLVSTDTSNGSAMGHFLKDDTYIWIGTSFPYFVLMFD